MIACISLLAFMASCSAPAGTPANSWRCGGTGPSYSIWAWLWVLALAHLAASLLKAPRGPIQGALGASATSSVAAVRQ
jgi:hypothetical protein